MRALAGGGIVALIFGSGCVKETSQDLGCVGAECTQKLRTDEPPGQGFDDPIGSGAPYLIEGLVSVERSYPVDLDPRCSGSSCPDEALWAIDPVWPMSPTSRPNNPIHDRPPPIDDDATRAHRSAFDAPGWLEAPDGPVSFVDR